VCRVRFFLLTLILLNIGAALERHFFPTEYQQDLEINGGVMIVSFFPINNEFLKLRIYKIFRDKKQSDLIFKTGA
jgi:hypothetical protein